jgi:hypothetical protein
MTKLETWLKIRVNEEDKEKAISEVTYLFETQKK